MILRRTLDIPWRETICQKHHALSRRRVRETNRNGLTISVHLSSSPPDETALLRNFACAGNDVDALVDCLFHNRQTLAKFSRASDIHFAAAATLHARVTARAGSSTSERLLLHHR